GNEAVLSWRVFAVAVRGEAGLQIEAGLSARNEIEHTRSEDCSQHLRDDIGQYLRSGKTPAGPKSNRYRRIEVTARDRSERVGSSQHCEPERERDARETNAQLGK